jgi:hypothetical protein
MNIRSPSCRLENVIWLRRNCSNVVISFTLPERPSILLKADRIFNIHNGKLEMTGNLLYRNRQMMALESSIKTGNAKSFKFLVSTPLELFRRLRLDAELIGDMNSWRMLFGLDAIVQTLL